jgi:hypothetical protein
VAGHEEGSQLFGGKIMNKTFHEEMERMKEAMAIGNDNNKVLVASSVKVGSLRTFEVEMTAHHSFLPERVIIPCICEKDFQIVGMTVNGIAQLFIKKGMSAKAFSEKSFCSKMKMDPCPCSAKINVVVRNVCSGERTFTIAIGGPKIKDSEIKSEVEKGN